MTRSAPTVGLTAIAALSLIGSVSATGTLSLSFEKKTPINGRLEPLKGVHRRDTSTVSSDVFDVQPWSGGGAYYTNVTVGTPPQTLTVILDTGSSDLYFDASGASSCQSTTADNSCRGGSFDQSSSKTYKIVNQGAFQTRFGDGSTADGDYSTDVVGIGNVQIPNVQFGVANQVNSTTGYAVSLLGVGYSANEAAANRYPNMPEILKEAGAINSRLYSVFLNQFGDATGNILFGGIDTSQYTGSLQTLNLLPVESQDSSGNIISEVYQFVVSVTGLKGTANGKTTTMLSGGDPTGQNQKNSLPVLLDTGSAAWSIPTKYFDQIVSLFGSNVIDENRNLLCSHQNDNISLAVEFGGQVTINVPVKNFVVPVYDPTTNKAATDSKGDPVCTFMISEVTQAEQEGSLGFNTLGDAILRSMYVVFDLDNGQVSIAQANTNPGSSNVKVVPSGANGIASAVGSNGVSTASSNAATIATMIQATQSFSFSTAGSAAGTATGVDAVPEQGRVSETATSGSGTSSGSSASASGSKGAAASLRPEGSSGLLMVLALWVGSAVVGFGLLM